jgi:beta-lactamase class A
MDALRNNAEREIAHLAAAARGAVGVAALHLENGRALAHDADASYPMASTVKVPLAVTVLAQAAAGRFNLAAPVEVHPTEMNPSGPVSEEFRHGRVALSPRALIDPMITRSDNTATDVLLRLVGGPSAVQDHMRALDIDGIRVDRTIRELLLVLYALKDPGPSTSIYQALFGLGEEEMARRRARAAAPDPDYSRDPRDQATPRAMLALLAKLHRAEGITPSNRDILLEIMSRTTTGLRRIRGRLPPGVAVADKTGSACGTTNDAGLITLPHGAGTLALVVYIKESPLPVPDREDIIADIARLAYDYAMLTA